MIIQIRGTSGSGKTTAMRAVMAFFQGWQPHMVEGRRKPLWYTTQAHGRTLVVLGHYEIDCGGCDTIGSAPDVYEVCRQAIGMYGPRIVVLSEGLLWGEDVKWSLDLVKQGYPVRPFFLTTTLEECLRRVELRQDGREPKDKERVVRKLTRRITTIESARRRLVAAGVECRRCSSSQAPRLVLNVIRSL